MELRNYEENTKASKLDRPSGLGEYDQKQMGIIPVSYYPLSFAYMFPDVAALVDRPYISRSSAVRPSLRTLAPIQSSTSFSQDLVGLPLFLWPSTFPSGINFSSVWCLLYVQNNLGLSF